MRSKVYRKLLFIFLGMFFLILCGVIAFNYFVDAGNQFYFAKTFEKRLVDALLEQKPVLVCANYNDRLQKKEMLERLTTQPDVLLLGSSRTMPVRQTAFQEKSLFNASVSSAGLEDDIALYSFYAKRGWKPKVVVINLDPWLVESHNNMPLKWKMNFASEYSAAQRILFGKSDNAPILRDQINGVIDKYSQLLISDYLRACLSKIVRRKIPPTGVIIEPSLADSEHYPFCNIYYPDGARMISSVDNGLTASQVDFISLDDVKQNTHKMGLDPASMKIFERFVDYLTAQNTKVIFFFPPYEPVAYKEIQKDPDYRQVNDIEKYFLSLAVKYHTQVIGSYDPSKLNLHSDNFVDYIHLKNESINNVFTR